jgi:endonuclease/exonuclease/phosphatase family metal-dependent hydrolase
MNGRIPLLDADVVASLRERFAQGHPHLDAEIPWLDEVDGSCDHDVETPSVLRVAAFNAERGTHFEPIVELFRDVGADVLLLSEVDWGMARSGNRHVARDFADALALNYAFGVEFVELTKGDEREAQVEGDNTQSLHGNAILSRWPLQNARTIRLPRKYEWNEGHQARLGGRMALVAEVRTAAGPLTLASTHLENRTTPEGRQAQMQAVLEALGTAAAAVIAGDLNTSTIHPDDPGQLFAIPDMLRADPQRLVRPQPYEPLFADVRVAGFLTDEANEADVSTSVPLGIEDPAFWLKLDWIFVRGPRIAGAPRTIRAVRDERRISDHDLVYVDLDVGSTAAAETGA